MKEYVDPQTERFVSFVKYFVEDNPAVKPFYEMELLNSEVSRIYGLIDEEFQRVDFQGNAARYIGYEQCLMVCDEMISYKRTPDDFEEVDESFLRFFEDYIKKNPAAIKALLNSHQLMSLKDNFAQNLCALRDLFLIEPGVLHDDPEYQPTECTREDFEKQYRNGLIKAVDECLAIALQPILISVE